MPRAKNSVQPQQIVEDDEGDFLQVDKPIPGQNYCCLSFVSPESIISDKKLFFFHNYCNYRMAQYQGTFNQGFEKLVESAVDGKIDVANIINLRKDIVKYYADDKLDFAGFKEKFEDFLYRDEEKISEVYDRANKFRTSVRGLKVRGVYDTKKEADVRAAAIQRLDPNFDVFVGQVGYWLPWDPTNTKIEDQEYLNQDLNKLVKEYKANESKKDQFFQEQKEQRMKGALPPEKRAEHAAGLKATRDAAQAQAQAQAQQAQQGQQQGQQAQLTDTPDTINTQQMQISDIIDSSDSAPNVSNMQPISGMQNANTPFSTGISSADAIDMNAMDPWLARKMQQAQQAQQAQQTQQ